MDSSAIGSVVSAISGSSPTASIAVSLLNQADNATKQEVATLFSSLGIGERQRLRLADHRARTSGSNVCS